MSEQNVELVNRFVSAFGAGEIADALATLTEDVVVHEAPNTPYPGDHRGREGFARLAEAFGQIWDVQRHGGTEILPAGTDKVVLTAESDVIAKPTGKSLTFRVIEIYTIVDGQIADIRVHYWDTAEMVEATGGKKVLETAGQAG